MIPQVELSIFAIDIGGPNFHIPQEERGVGTCVSVGDFPGNAGGQHQNFMDVGCGHPHEFWSFLVLFVEVTYFLYFAILSPFCAFNNVPKS